MLFQIDNNLQWPRATCCCLCPQTGSSDSADATDAIFFDGAFVHLRLTETGHSHTVYWRPSKLIRATSSETAQVFLVFSMRCPLVPECVPQSKQSEEELHSRSGRSEVVPTSSSLHNWPLDLLFSHCQCQYFLPVLMVPMVPMVLLMRVCVGGEGG